MTKLQVLKEEHHRIVEDRRYTDHIHRRDLEDIEYNNFINNKCRKALLQNDKYISLSNKSIELFNSLKCLIGKDLDLLFDYEEIIAKMQEIVEVEAFELGRYE